MTPTKLKQHVKARGGDYFWPYYMNKKGDRMRNFGCRSDVFTYADGRQREVWKLIRKEPVKDGYQKSALFDKKTFEWLGDF